ncbi:MAG: VCBS repeat-containing protein [Ignavibacteria bacterium]|nr:VCBS repeat-containing protein [Ignavibacteria bacterium]MCU7519618.1 VCBS repeat-containing protein [Ignavibacteria bacterium]
MKYAATMKLYTEGKIDLRRVTLTAISLLLAGYFLVPVNAQIPVNGFCRYQSFPVREGFHSFASLSFNGDAYTDLAMFDPLKKEIFTFAGQAEGSFKPGKTSRLKNEISFIEPIDKNLPGTLCAFISRKNRIAGLLNFSNSGSPNILSELRLDSYPGGMSLMDINSDGHEEILLYGEAFNGLSIIYRNQGRLREKKILNGKIYSHAVWTDLNHDSYPDIIAVELVTNSLKFLYNNSRGEFYEAREMKGRGKITSLLAYDFNLDGLQDIIAVQGNGIYILYGDYVSSFNKTQTIATDFRPDEVVISDFNRDGLNDIAYLDRSRSVVSAAFSRENGSFFREINYLARQGISHIAPYYSKFLTGLLSLDSGGKLYLISSLSVIKDNVSLSLGASPSDISYFDAGNNDIIDLCAVDRFRPALNIMLRDKSGIPSHYYSVDLVEACTNLEIYDKKTYEKTFYCYTRGKRLIQAVTVNFKYNRISKNNFYAAGPIFDLKAIDGQGADRTKLFAALISNGNLRLEVFDYVNYKYASLISKTLETGTADAKIDQYSPFSIFYWKEGKGCFYFKKLILDRELKQQKYLNEFTLKSKVPAWITGDILNQDEGSSANFIFDSNNYYAFISNINKNVKFKLKGSFSAFKIRNSNMLSLGEVRFNGLKKLLVYNDADRTLEKLDVLNKSGILLTTRLIEAGDVESYFVKNMNFRKYHFVYADKSEKCVTIKELP